MMQFCEQYSAAFIRVYESQREIGGIEAFWSPFIHELAMGL